MLRRKRRRVAHHHRVDRLRHADRCRIAWSKKNRGHLAVANRLADNLGLYLPRQVQRWDGQQERFEDPHGELPFNRFARYNAVPLVTYTKTSAFEYASPAERIRCSPAMYAAATRRTSPWNNLSRWHKYATPPRTFCAISKRFVTPNVAAVAGMSCMSPAAPLLETARGCQPDSTSMIEWTSSRGTR